MSDTDLPVGKIVAGDCLKTMARWPAASVDLVFADPPYNIGYRYDQYEDKRDDHDYVDWTQAWVDGCVRLLKPSGSLYILIGDEYAAETRVHLKKLEREHKLVFRNWIIWHYTFGQNCKAKFNRSHAHLFYAVGPAAFDKDAWKVTGNQWDQTAATQDSAADESGPKALDSARARGHGVEGTDDARLPFVFNRAAVAVPSARQLVYGDVRANPGGKLPDDVWYTRPQQALDDQAVNGNGYFSPDGDTWYLSRLCGTFKERVGWHPCQLPEALLERIITVSSRPGEVVFDPFAGSGTTLAVAARLERQWLGCELSKEYAAKAQQRIRHAQRTGKPLATSYNEKNIVVGRPKKKAEPHRSPKPGTLFQEAT